MTTDYRTYYASHIAEVQRRWETAMDAENLQGILVHSGTPIISFQDDFEYAFRPNPNFLAWLPLTHHSDSALLIRPGHRPLLYYYQPDDYWHLPPADPEPWWAELFDVRVVQQPDAWKSGLLAQLNGLSFGLDDIAAIGDAPILASVFDRHRINPESLVTRLHVSRTTKTAYEIGCMQAASELGARAHLAAEAAFREGHCERVIHQHYLSACGQSDAELPYHSIVALNHHGAVLHYQGRSDVAPPKSLSFLIDAGCTVNAYASDITRTYAAEAGVFADLVAAMEKLQLDLVSEVRAGLDYRQLHLVTHAGVAGLLADFDLITVSATEAVESGLSGVFYPHGLGHFIGLQTHDVAGLIDDSGDPIERPEGHPFLRLTRVLESGNVLTIEPGLYFIEPLLRQWKEQRDASMINWREVQNLMPFGGIRIEDNVVVTPTGSENLTRQAFAALA